MRVEILAIGNELLDGSLADTNTARLAGVLRARGLGVHRGQTVPDEPDAIIGALAHAATRSDLVLVTGGLGPTEDDLTVDAAAAFAGVPLEMDQAILEHLKARYAGRGFPFTPNNAKQARVPRGATSLHNAAGTAPGVRLEHADTTFFFFPGVPREVQRLAEDHLLPWVDAHAPERPMESRVFKTFGKTESQVATLLEPLPRDPRVHVAYRAHFPEIRLTLHATHPDAAARQALLDELSGEVRRLLGTLIFSETPGDTMAGVVARELTTRGLTLATAESCTGGLIASLLTDVPGASAWFREGAVTYANEAKTRRLGVDPALLDAHGAVSEPVARAMAQGQRAATGADLAVAVTGIAGPTGGTEDKPVGTVHLALASAQGTTHLHRRLPFDRRRNRLGSAWAAMDLVRRHLVGG